MLLLGFGGNITTVLTSFIRAGRRQPDLLHAYHLLPSGILRRRKQGRLMKTPEKSRGNVRIIEMTPKDAGKVPLYGHKDPSKACYQHKFQWITKHMSEGLKVKMLHTPDDGVVGYIEYIPGERAWRAVNAANYLFIHCLYMERRCKGRGYGTLQGCQEGRYARCGHCHTREDPDGRQGRVPQCPN